MAVVDIIPSEYTPTMFSDLLFGSGMLFEEFFYLFVFVEIFTVVNQLRIVLQVSGNTGVFNHETVELSDFVAHLGIIITPSSAGEAEERYCQD